MNKHNKILVVDDDPDVLLATSYLLKKAGYEVIEAKDHDQCMLKLHEHTFGLVLLDVMLPGKDGYEICSEIKSNNELKNTFIIFISSKRISPEEQAKGLKLGAEGYITRPFQKEEFLARVEAMLRINDVEKKLVASEEKLLSSEKRLSTTNSLLRHDISNELAIIISAVKLFRRQKDEMLLDEVLRHTAKSLSLIKLHKKQESRIKSNTKLDLIDISSVINEIKKDFKRLEIQVSGNCSVYADNAIYSVFENLFNNAINHGKATKVDISINKKEDKCEIKVSDNGIGIPDSIKPTIFEKGFYHGKSGNTGIGLFIVKQTIEEYKGSVSVEDNKPNGATFILTLRNGIDV